MILGGGVHGEGAIQKQTEACDIGPNHLSMVSFNIIKSIYL